MPTATRRTPCVHYPADYQKGKAYPTVFIIYEDFFDDTLDVAANMLVGATATSS